MCTELVRFTSTTIATANAVSKRESSKLSLDHDIFGTFLNFCSQALKHQKEDPEGFENSTSDTIELVDSWTSVHGLASNEHPITTYRTFIEECWDKEKVPDISDYPNDFRRSPLISFFHL